MSGSKPEKSTATTSSNAAIEKQFIFTEVGGAKMWEKIQKSLRSEEYRHQKVADDLELQVVAVHDYRVGCIEKNDNDQAHDLVVATHVTPVVTNAAQPAFSPSYSSRRTSPRSRRRKVPLRRACIFRVQKFALFLIFVGIVGAIYIGFAAPTYQETEGRLISVGEVSQNKVQTGSASSNVSYCNKKGCRTKSTHQTYYKYTCTFPVTYTFFDNIQSSEKIRVVTQNHECLNKALQMKQSYEEFVHNNYDYNPLRSHNNVTIYYDPNNPENDNHITQPQSPPEKSTAFFTICLVLSLFIYMAGTFHVWFWGRICCREYVEKPYSNAYGILFRIGARGWIVKTKKSLPPQRALICTQEELNRMVDICDQSIRPTPYIPCFCDNQERMFLPIVQNLERTFPKYEFDVYPIQVKVRGYFFGSWEVQEYQVWVTPKQQQSRMELPPIV